MDLSTYEPAATPLCRVYKNTAEGELNLHLFLPERSESQTKLPVIVFFFGGGWKSGTTKQFYPHCEYFASRGMAAISADYRVRSRHGTTPFASISDGKSAIRRVRELAEEFQLDSGKVAAAGGSAGGHVAACSGILPGWDEENENQAVSSVPNALILFNPVVDVMGTKVGMEAFGDRTKEGSPYHHLAHGAPPTLIFHGTEDRTVPVETVERFADRMGSLHNGCELVKYEGKDHGFFNYGRHHNEYFHDTLRRSDLFLISQGFLQGNPHI